MIKQLSTKTVYENKWMKVREDSVEFADGKQGIYGVIEKPDFSLIMPYENDGFHLVNQYRYPVKQSFWEFPQGSYEDNAQMSAPDVAKGELQDETGFIAQKIKEIGYLYEAYGFSNQGFHIFLAENLEKKQQNLESSEFGMEVGFFKLNEFKQMILDGKITDAPTIAAYGLFLTAI